ncbi:MAG: UTP--glucose-1-phosphate uridylyltransferase [Actinomycetota bacterium]
MPVRKAVIPAAGLGTRFLPATKAVAKELLPIVDQPLIQYAVEELVRAGITNICIVTSSGKEGLADHFASAGKLEAALARTGKLEQLDSIRRLHEMAEIYSVRQNEPLGLGHAVWVARDHVQDEPFVVLLPDEMLDPQRNFLGEMLNVFDETATSVVAVHEVPHEEVKLYGSIATDDPSASLIAVTDVIEKPDPSVAPSDLVLSGRYVLDPEVFEILTKLEPGASQEVQLADALGVLARRRQLNAMEYVGRRWDVGTKAGYLKAVVTLGAEHPELGEDFRSFLRTFKP